MKDEISYIELVNELKDPSKPLFGGSLAYMTIETNICLLIKLLDIKIAKNSDDKSSLVKVRAIASSLLPFSHEMITKDGLIFDKLRSTKDPIEKDKIVNEIFYPSYAYIDNLSTLTFYIDRIITITKGTLKHDFAMISDVIESCKRNLISILRYEVKKLSDDLKKQEYLDIINEL